MPPLPRLAFLNAALLPSEVTVLEGVARDAGRRNRAVAFVAVVRPQAGGSGGASEVELGFPGWRATLGAVVPVHVEHGSDGSPAAGVAAGAKAFCGAPRPRRTAATPGGRIAPAGRAAALASALAAACSGRGALAAPLAALAGPGLPTQPAPPVPPTCFGVVFPGGEPLRYGYRAGCPMAVDGFKLAAATTDVTAVPAGCRIADLGGGTRALECFPHDGYAPGETIEGEIGVASDPAGFTAFVTLNAARTEIQFTPVRQASSGCTATWRRLGPPEAVSVEVSCPSTARLARVQVHVFGSSGDPSVTAVRGGIARSCAADAGAVLCTGYFLPGFPRVAPLRLELGLGAPATGVQVIAQLADGAWEPVPDRPRSLVGAGPVRPG